MPDLTDRIHPDLAKALKEAEADDWARLVAIGIRAAFGEEVCACSEPGLEGTDLMCRKCLCENEQQQQRAEELVSASHEFEPGGLLGFCNHYLGVGVLRCLQRQDHERHQGVEVERCLI